MSSYGVIPEGFNEKTLDVLLEELQEAERAAYGPNINTQADSVLGQLNGIYADKLAELWEVALAIYRAQYPDTANDEALDNVAAITGTTRLSAAPSQVTLDLSLAATTTVAAGKVARIGSSGARWVLTEAVTNAAAYPATVQGLFESEEAAPVVGNAYAINSIATPVSGWSAKAALNSLNSEPFHLVDAQTLQLQVDQGATQTVTFATGDFVDIGNATAQEVADAIKAATTGLDAVDANGQVRLVSDTDGEGSAIEVTAGTANPALAFAFELIKGFNPNRSAKIVCGSSEPYDLDNGDTLFVQVDGGTSQQVDFETGDFVDIDNALAREVAAVINQDVSGARAYDVGGKVQIESLTVGVNSSIEVSGGSANAEFQFPDTDDIGESGDATLGRSLETDAELRLRREELLRLSGAATIEAIRSTVRSVDGVLQAFVFENASNVTDGFGRPPKSFEVVVQGGEDLDIGEAIWETKPAGIETFREAGASGVTVSITDSQGISHDVNFSRATQIRMYVAVTVKVDLDLFGGGEQAAGEQEVKEAIELVGDSLQIGEDVIINKFLCAPFGVTGVVDVTAIAVDDVTPPVNTSNISIADRELATFSDADITVTVTT
jgi:uncharacterized phage protein gp47/JayE